MSQHSAVLGDSQIEVVTCPSIELVKFEFRSLVKERLPPDFQSRFVIPK